MIAFQYDLTLVASDSLNEVEIPAVIYVRDLNDLPPEFEQMQYVVNITEETVFVDAPLIQVPSARSLSSLPSLIPSSLLKIAYITATL